MIEEWVWYCHYQASAPTWEQWLDLPIRVRRVMTKKLNKLIEAYNAQIPDPVSE